MSPDAILALLKQRFEFTSRYDVESWTLLGTGAFAVVARVYNRMLDQPVAVKVFHRFEPTIKKRLQAEVTNTQRLRSHAVVQIYTAFFLGDDTAWLEMECVDGPDLQRELDRREEEGRPLTTAEALELALAATVPVAEAHAAGVIHRDLKPSNYLLPSSRTPLVKLGDFGISKHLQDAALTGTGQFPGTPAWACPEAYEGMPLGTAADVYNLAALAFLLLAGRSAYDLPRRASPSQWLAAHRHSSPRRVRDFKPELPASLEDALRRGLHKDPARRLSLSELADAIRAAKEHEVARVFPAPAPSAPRRLPRLLAGLGLVLVLAALATPAFRRQSGPSVAPPLVAPSGSAATLAARPSSPSTQAPAPATERAHPQKPLPGFRVELDSEWLTLTNATGAGVTDVTVAVVGPDGAEAAAEAKGDLGPGEEITLPVGAFSPRPVWPPQRIMVSADTPSGRRSFPTSSRAKAQE